MIVHYSLMSRKNKKESYLNFDSQIRDMQSCLMKKLNRRREGKRGAGNANREGHKITILIVRNFLNSLVIVL